MAGIAAAILGAGAIGAGASIFGSMTQANAARNAANIQQGEFNTALQGEQPFIKAGQEAIPTLQSLVTPGPSQTATLSETPGFKFASDIAQKAVSNQGTVTGLGGNTLLAGSNAATQLALGSAWQPTVNALLSLINTGAGTAGNVGTQAVGTGANVGSSVIGAGNAIAGGATSVGANLGNSLTSAALFSKLLNNSNMYGPTGSNSLVPSANPIG